MANDLPIEQVMENLKINPHKNPTKGHMKDGNGSPSDATSCISSTGDASGSVKEGEADCEQSTMPYSPNNYYGYYYPGYEGYPGAIEGQGYYVSGDGLEMQYPVMVDDNGNLMCIMPEGYNPYTQYLPMATIAVDGQYINQPASPISPIFSPSIASPGYFPTHSPYGSELVSPTYMWNQSYMVGDGVYPNGYCNTPISKPNVSSSGYNNTKPTSGFKNALANKAPLSELEISSKYGTRSQPKGLSKATQHGSTTQLDSVQAKSNVTFTKFPSNNQSKGHVNLKATAQSGYENLKTLNNHAPVTKGDTTTSLDVDLNNDKKNSASLVKRELYNLPEFPTKYEHAVFFVIKSYSEDDIHKSIKYNVWASTPNGNKRLDSVYQEAQEKVSKCPVFLFFSVNASGQFCGVAEMLGRVDFNKSMDFWQQDKWNGYFPVKWHIIKDVPNPQLRHIILENNENKPVTNSRDTQEVRLPQGIEMLSIFKKYVSKTSILDDFEFYESRQKVMQEKRIRPSTFRYDAVQKANELSRGFQVTDVHAIKKIDEIQVGENAVG